MSQEDLHEAKALIRQAGTWQALWVCRTTAMGYGIGKSVPPVEQAIIGVVQQLSGRERSVLLRWMAPLAADAMHTAAEMVMRTVEAQESEPCGS